MKRPVKRHLILSTGLLLATLLLSGCAAVIKGRLQEVPFSSSPQGAEVIIDGQSHGTTPVRLMLEADRDYEVILRLGNQQRRVIITSGVAGQWIALDAVPAVAAGTLAILNFSRPRSPDSWFKDLERIGDIASGVVVVAGLAPLIVDAGTGAWYELTPGEISVDFNAPAR